MVYVCDFVGVNLECLELFLLCVVVEGLCDFVLVRESRLRFKRAIRLLTRFVLVMCVY